MIQHLCRLACAALLVLGGGSFGVPTGGEGRVIVLGFDGADANAVQRLMDKGELPNLAKLRQQGSFAPLGTATPIESPVAWASLNSGQNPAKTGVSGFVTRKLDTNQEPQPVTGFYSNETRKAEELKLPFWQRFLVARTPLSAAWILGLASALCFALVLLFLLKLSRWVALALALLLGAAGAWGGWSASRALPRSIEDVWVNSTKAGGFWEVAARAGVPSVVVDGAMAWDRPEVPGAKVLAGLGLPDARGDYGSWCLYTTHDEEQDFSRPPAWRDTGSGGRVFRVEEHDGRIDTFLYGPNDELRREHLGEAIEELQRELDRSGLEAAHERELEQKKADLVAEQRDVERTRASPSDEYRLFVPMTLTRVGKERLEVRIGEEKQLLAQGQWSYWFHPRFDGSPLFQIHTVTRVKLRKLADPLELVVGFLDFDPRNPSYYQPVSQPQGFAGELARAIGADYETVGWACMTHGFKDGEIDPRTFLEDIEFTQGWRRKLLLAALERDDWKLLVDVESTPDRVQHMCYQYSDPAHPLYDAAAAGEKIRFFGEEISYAQAIDASYRALDRLVGETLSKLRPDDVLLVCSDHGFQSFRRQCHLTNWLAEHGYLALQPNLQAGAAAFPLYIDWTKTQAYAVGLGMIFVNEAGREAQGIVPRAQVDELLERIEKDLLATEDGGQKAVRSVRRLRKIHSGPCQEDEADLVVGFEAGWRVGWPTTTGRLKLEKQADGSMRPASTFSDNKYSWSGDHVSVSDDLVRGIFFCNRKLELPSGGPDLLDVAPTALDLLGVPVPAEYDHHPLLTAR